MKIHLLHPYFTVIIRPRFYPLSNCRDWLDCFSNSKATAAKLPPLACPSPPHSWQHCQCLAPIRYFFLNDEKTLTVRFRARFWLLPTMEVCRFEAETIRRRLTQGVSLLLINHLLIWLLFLQNAAGLFDKTGHFMNLLNFLSSFFFKVVIQLIEIQLNNFYNTFYKLLPRIIPFIETSSECIENFSGCDWKRIINNEILFEFFFFDELKYFFLKCLEILWFFLLDL